MNVQKKSNTLQYHEKILQAIMEGDSNLAKMYMYMHLSLLKDFMVQKSSTENGISVEDETTA